MMNAHIKTNYLLLIQINSVLDGNLSSQLHNFVITEYRHHVTAEKFFIRGQKCSCGKRLRIQHIPLRDTLKPWGGRHSPLKYTV